MEIVYLSHHCVLAETFTFHNPVQATAKPWSPWKVFLLCLLACLIATALVVLLFYFVHLGKPAAGTTIIIHADGKSSHVTCIPGAAPSPGPSSLPVSQSALPPTPGTNYSSSTPGLPTPTETTMSSTLVHEVEFEDEEWHLGGVVSPPQARPTHWSWTRHVQGILPSSWEVPKHLAFWDLPSCSVICCVPYENDTSVLSQGPSNLQMIGKEKFQLSSVDSSWLGPRVSFHLVKPMLISLMRISTAGAAAGLLYVGSQATIYHPVIDYFPISYTWLFLVFLFQ